MEVGYVKLWRKIRENGLWPKGQYTPLERWIDLLLSANITSKKWQGVTIPRGTFITNQRDLSKKWRISVGGCNKFLFKLKSEQQIELKTDGGYTHIKILNYPKYQDKSEQQSEHEVNTEETQSEHEVKLLKNDKNERMKEDNAKALVPSARNEELDNLIEFSETKMFPLQGTIKGNRFSAFNLLKKFGLDKSKWLVAASVDCRGKPFSPTISDFTSLYRKAGDLVTFYKKNGDQNGNRIGKI
jgi:hypothetical protein